MCTQLNGISSSLWQANIYSFELNPAVKSNSISGSALLNIKMSNSTALTGLLAHPHGNAPLIADPDTLCTLAFCDLTLVHVDNIPSLVGNPLFAVLFASCFLAQLLLGIKYRT